MVKADAKPISEFSIKAAARFLDQRRYYRAAELLMGATICSNVSDGLTRIVISCPLLTNEECLYTEHKSLETQMQVAFDLSGISSDEVVLVKPLTPECPAPTA